MLEKVLGGGGLARKVSRKSLALGSWVAWAKKAEKCGCRMGSKSSALRGREEDKAQARDWVGMQKVWVAEGTSLEATPSQSSLGPEALAPLPGATDDCTFLSLHQACPANLGGPGSLHFCISYSRSSPYAC